MSPLEQKEGRHLWVMRGTGIGVVYVLVPPACVCVHIRMCVCVCVSVCMCVYMCRSGMSELLGWHGGRMATWTQIFFSPTQENKHE